jgi:hypothetical protein
MPPEGVPDGDTANVAEAEAQEAEALEAEAEAVEAAATTTETEQGEATVPDAPQPKRFSETPTA